jgi:hypothetical protein
MVASGTHRHHLRADRMPATNVGGRIPDDNHVSRRSLAIAISDRVRCALGQSTSFVIVIPAKDPMEKV